MLAWGRNVNHNHRLRRHLRRLHLRGPTTYPGRDAAPDRRGGQLRRSAHRFTLDLVPPGMDFAISTGIPAVYGQAIQSMQGTPETLLRTNGPPPSKVVGNSAIQ